EARELQIWEEKQILDAEKREFEERKKREEEEAERTKREQEEKERQEREAEEKEELRVAMLPDWEKFSAMADAIEDIPKPQNITHDESVKILIKAGLFLGQACDTLRRQ
ncbi:hypothetical protein LCGC14_1950670, partial [marine sediment metagenome]